MTGLRFRIPAHVLLMAAALPLSACAQSGGPAIAGPGTCDATKVQWAVGQAAEKDTVGRAWRESGAGLIRPIAPGQAVRNDTRADRLTLYIDNANVITQVVCR